MESLEEANRKLREAVAARMAATSPEDPKMVGYKAAVPSAVIETPAPRIEYDSSDIWARWRDEAASDCNRDPVAVKAAVEPRVERAQRRPIIGFAGMIGAGKTAAAAMLPGVYAHFQWADPLYRGLAAMLSIDESLLRDRTLKDQPLAPQGYADLLASPRKLLETLGTDWGREMIHPDIWVMMTMARVNRLGPGEEPVAICGTRFPNEVAAIRAAGGEVWWIVRPGSAVGTVHSSGYAITHRDCDAVIMNDGSIEDLRGKITRAWEDYSAARN